MKSRCGREQPSFSQRGAARRGQARHGDAELTLRNVTGRLCQSPSWAGGRRTGARPPTRTDAVPDAGQLPCHTGVAPHLLRDLDAARAGLTLEWGTSMRLRAWAVRMTGTRYIPARAGCAQIPADGQVL